MRFITKPAKLSALSSNNTQWNQHTIVNILHKGGNNNNNNNYYYYLKNKKKIGSKEPSFSPSEPSVPLKCIFHTNMNVNL
jgi:hypothetical protein